MPQFCEDPRQPAKQPDRRMIQMNLLLKIPTANEQAPADKTVTGQQKRALRKLLRDLIVFISVAAADVAVAPRKVPQRKRHRLLCRRADTLSDDEGTRLVIELGPERVLRVVDRLTQPQLPLVTAE
jgi:hypothetical protein